MSSMWKKALLYPFLADVDGFQQGNWHSELCRSSSRASSGVLRYHFLFHLESERTLVGGVVGHHHLQLERGDLGIESVGVGGGVAAEEGSHWLRYWRFHQGIGDEG
jgi:hypothetical protein